MTHKKQKTDGWYIKEFTRKNYTFNFLLCSVFILFECSVITVILLLFSVSEVFLNYEHFMFLSIILCSFFVGIFSYINRDLLKLHEPIKYTEKYLCYTHLGVENIICKYENGKEKY